MWSAKDRNFMYRDVFQLFYDQLGTDLSYEQVASIKVDINKDPEGYEKLRQIVVKYFDIPVNYTRYIDDLGYVGLTDFDAARDLIENFVRIANNIGGQSLNIQSTPGEIFRQLIEYEQVSDRVDIGELSKLKRIANGKSVFTIRELFDFFHFELKTYFVGDYNYDNDFGSVINAVMYVFNYNQEYILSYDRTLIKKIVKHWKEQTENDLLIYPYEEAKNLIFEATSKGKGANSPLRSVFRTIVNVVKWITAEKRFDRREKAICTFMQKLQELSKPVKEF